MGANAQGQPGLIEEVARDIGAEHHSRPPSLGRHATEAVVGVGPLRVEYDLLLLAPLLVLLRVRVAPLPSPLWQTPEPRQARRWRAEEAAVHDEHLLPNHREEREHLEQVPEGLAHSRAVLVQALLLEAPALCERSLVHLLILVVAPQQMHRARATQLEEGQEQEDLAREGSPVGDVAVEDVHHGVRGQAMHREDVENILQLSMCVANDNNLGIVAGHRHRDVYHRRVYSLKQLGQVPDRLLRCERRHRDLGRIRPEPLEQLLRARRRPQRRAPAGTVGIEAGRLGDAWGEGRRRSILPRQLPADRRLAQPRGAFEQRRLHGEAPAGRQQGVAAAAPAHRGCHGGKRLPLDRQPRKSPTVSQTWRSALGTA
mmetsp:Transcript_31048/g.89518  ORF Transcript_31048/g.89518 Transcript_31048/m.89518 type:complete len:371 (+) Transcript_31048:507-1619(+)